MKIFVVNCGSSSIKYQLFDMADERVLAKGLLERVGSDDARLRHEAGSARLERTVAAPDHAAGLGHVLGALLDAEDGVLGSVEEIDGIGHRVVHGGEQMREPALVNEEVLGVIEANSGLSPLHNPPNLAGIRAARAAVEGKPNVAVFDTAFLATLPPKAHRYAVPAAWYRDHGVRKYGFHGTSHWYVAGRAAELLGKPLDELNAITVHLGNGCSMTAVAGGRAVDHSMGMTPLEGLVMGTRCGDVDAAVVRYMVGRGLSVEEVDRVLNQESGLLGLSEQSNDMRDLLAAADRGHEGARLAIEMFVYRIVKYVGAYYAVLPTVDAVVLTGGIGENSVPVRAALCQQLERLGVLADAGRNAAVTGGAAGPITADGAALPVWVIPTNEELLIARQTQRIVLAAQ